MPFKKWWPFRSRKNDKRLEKNTYSSLEKVYTPVNELVVGMYVVELDRPWLETSFPFQGFELKNEAMIKSVRDVCNYVYVDLTNTKVIKQTVPPVSEKAHGNTPNITIYGVPPKRLSVFEKEILKTEEIYQTTGTLVSDFMEKIASGGGIDTRLAKNAVAECVNSVLHSPDAVLWLSQLKHRDEYTAQHSLNVCVLSIVLGRHINLSEANLNIVGLCGMMHDMGKMLVPLKILNKPGKLEDDEMEIMQSHTVLGYDLLKSSDDMHPSAIDVAYSHHERLDGKGYPRQVSKSKLTLFSRIVTITDMYDAITSDRVYQKGRTHLDATNILWNMAGTQLDPVLVVKFIESIGVYPPGCLVQMTNGAVGIVVEINEKLRLRPKVIIILDEDKKPVAEKILDLSQMILDRQGCVYTIKGIVRAEDCNIDASKYYHEGVLQRGFMMANK
ncbi:MAG: HD-GYP domain-containing protein [Methylococcaceae bacterium]